MARRMATTQRARLTKPALAGAAVLVIIVVGIASFSRMLAAGGGQLPTQAPANDIAAAPSLAPSKSPKPTAEGAGGGLRTHAPQASPSPTPTRRPPSPPTAEADSGAPNRPADFDLTGQAIDIDFPLRAETRYTFRDNFLEVRDGAPESYNHARLDGDGLLHRLHDGIDIYAAEGAPLVAPFSGNVIDPSTRWQPWIASRYGRTVVIVSDERNSRGYVALLVHADDVWVQPGDHVTRGQVVGTLGRTGNAEAQSIRPHLHFELRAPFLLDWTPVGYERQLDAFDPFPSLVEADPKRS